MKLRTCKACKLPKPYDDKAKPQSKASGFQGSLCWECRCVYNNLSNKKIKSAPGYKAKKNAYYANVLAKDPLYKLRANLGSRLWTAFKNIGANKPTNTEALVGCSWQQLRNHIETMFTPEMNWQNQGSYWHIDHIVPCARAKNIEELVKLCHYTNLQPLYGLDNCSKGCKLDWSK